MEEVNTTNSLPEHTGVQANRSKKKKSAKKISRVTDFELKGYDKFISEDVNGENLNEFLRVFNKQYGSDTQIYKDLRNLLRMSSKTELEMRNYYKNVYTTSLTKIASDAFSCFCLAYMEKDENKKYENVQESLSHLNLFGIHITELLTIKALVPKHSNEISTYFMKSFQGLLRYSSFVSKKINGEQQPVPSE